ncbi:MAG: Dabb family protein [Puia sp.]|nr:Dabb family protein [Puia sp.]
MSFSNVFVHHVFFWLKNPGSTADRDRLVAGLKKLSKTPSIKDFHIGLPAATDRSVIDRSYAVSWMVLFRTAADQDSYQVDPIHLEFVEECSPLWSKVLIYDSIDA